MLASKSKNQSLISNLIFMASKALFNLLRKWFLPQDRFLKDGIKAMQVISDLH